MSEKLNKAGHIAGAALTVSGVLAGIAMPLSTVNADEDVSSNTPMNVNASSAQMIKVDNSLNSQEIGSVHGEPLYIQDYDAKIGNSTYRAYCLNYQKYTPEGNAPHQGAPSANEYKVLLYGFPNRQPGDLGAKDWGGFPHRAVDVADRATQIAMWIEAGDFGFNDINWGNSGYAQNVKAVTQKILNDVNNDHSDPTKGPSGSMAVTGHSVNGTTTTFTFQASVNNDQPYGIQNTKLNISGLPSGAKITQNGKEISNGSSFDISKPIQVQVPGSMSASNLKVTWTGQTQHAAVQAAIFGAPAANQQSSIVYHYGPWNQQINGAADVNVPPTEGALHVHKVDSANKPVAGVKFGLFNGSNQIATATTDKDGNVQFNNLPAGQYSLKELDAPIQVRIDHATTPVTVAAGQTQNDTIGNTTVKGQVTSTTLADDGLHLTDALSSGNADETLHLSNLTTGVQMREVTKTVFQGTNTQVPGTQVQQQDFTPTKSSMDLNVKIPLKGGYKALEGKQITTMTTLYRVKGNQTLQLSQETNNADPNQTINVLQPTIQTLDSVAANGKANNQTVNPSHDTEVSDSQTMTNLIKGHKYTVDFDETVNGKSIGVHTSKTFTATGSTETITAALPKFDSTKYAGQTMTIHSDIKASDGTVIATHNDDNDKNEQIHITKPSMQTTALIDGAKEANPHGGSTLYDRVQYKDAAPGQPLNFKVLARKPNGQPIVVTDNGKQYYLEGNINYTPASANGEVDVPLMEVPVSSVKDASGSQGTPASSQSSSSKASSQTSSTSKASSQASSQASDKESQQTTGKPNQTTTDGSAADASNGVKNNGLVNSQTSQWTDTTAQDDAKYITIKPIQAGLEKTDPNKAAQQAGDNNTGLDNPYEINTRSLAGQDMGLAETMNSNDTGKGNEWTTEAHHSAHDSTDQAIHITAPKLHTEALLDGGHADMPSSMAQLFDKVDYSDVVPGDPLEISATGYDKQTGEPETFKVDGKTMELVGRETFIPKSTSGSINVPLQEVEVGKNFNASDMKISGNQTAQSAALRISENPLKVNAPVVQKGAQDAAKQAADKAMKDTKGNASQKAKAASSAAQNAAAKVTGNSELAQAPAQLATMGDVANTGAGLDNTIAGKNVASTSSSASTGSVLGLNSGSANSSSALGIGGTTATTDKATAAEGDNSKQAADVANQTNSALKNNDAAGTAQAAQAAAGDTKATMINTTSLAGKSMVMVEDLSEVNGNGSKRTVAQNWITSEADMNNNQQTVRVAKPSIHTEASINGQKNFKFVKGKDGIVKSITDTVDYNDFVPGKPQKVTVVEMDKATGKPVQIDGKYIVGTLTFTPKNANGSVTVQEHLTSQKPAQQYLTESLGESVKDDASTTSSNASSQASSMTSSSSNKASSSSKASSKSSMSSKAKSEQGSSSMSSSASSSSNNDEINLKSIGSRANWVNFETTQNVGQGNNVTAEGKDLNDNAESVAIIPTTPKKASSINVKMEQHQAQSQKGANATANAKGANATAKGGTGANGGNGAAGSPAQANATANGQGGAGQNGGGATATPHFAQTGGTGHVNKFFDWIYKMFH